MNLSTSALAHQTQDGEKRCFKSELWHACAGPLVSLPTVGSRVVYFPQGHSEQVVASTNKEVDGHIPNYPSLSPQLMCQLHNVTMHADVETDEVYAQMTLQPLSLQEQKDTYIPAELGITNKQPTNYFCKTLTASDTSTHGGFSVPRRAAEKVFPPLDFSQQPPVQELIARDLHDVEWKFRHIFRGQPKRHLLTTGWSIFVSAKRLVAGDSILFIWNENNQLLLGIRRANRPQTMMPSSMLSSDSMHIGLLAAAAHAAATNSRFTIFYNPRASPSEFVIPLSKYVKAVFHTRVSVGMRFRMLFETEESSARRYMGTITGISDLDPVRWPNSHWRSVKVGWDESMAGERLPRVSLWEIEPLTTFPMYPSLFPPRLKRPWHTGVSSLNDEGNVLTWLRGDTIEGRLQSINTQALGVNPWMQQSFDPLLLRNGHDKYQAMAVAALQDIRSGDSLRQQFLSFQQPFQSPPQLRPNPLWQQQIIQQTQSQQTLHAPTHSVTDNQTRNHLLPQQLLQPFSEQQKQQLQQHTYKEPFQISNNQSQQLQSPLATLLCQKPVFPDANEAFSSVPTSICVQGMLGSLGPEVSFNLLGEQHTQTWAPQFTTSQVDSFVNTVSFPPFPRRDDSLEPQNGNIDSQTHTLFGVNIDSPSVLRNEEPTLGTTAINTGVLTMPFAASGFQNSLHICADDSSGLLQNSVQVDAETKTFVKVYKTGSVGRSLDITRFSCYHELREELGQMFGIEGQLEDPLRSGWQLVFVDRENDVLLLGDDPWEAFVNNVWYIKILSPEDVQKLGKLDVESLNSTGDQKMSDNTCKLQSSVPHVWDTLSWST